MAGSLDIGIFAGAGCEEQSKDVRAGPQSIYLGVYNEPRNYFY